MTTTEEYEVQQEVARFREHPEQVISGVGVRTAAFNVPAFIIAQDLNPNANAPVWILPEDMPDCPTQEVAAVVAPIVWPAEDPDAPAAEVSEDRGRHWDNRVHHRDAVPAWFAEFTHAHTALLSFTLGALAVAVLVGLGLKFVIVLWT